MKFQIDTNLKTIKLEEKALLKEVLDIMKAMFPDNWKEYSIETNCIINWNISYPTVHWPYYTQPHWDLWPRYTNLSGYALTNNIGTLSQGYNRGSTYTTSCNSDTANIINIETQG